MARPGVTYFDISRAAEALKAQGSEPTIDRVREQLGTGSKSTIAPLLKQWRSNNESNVPEAETGLPADLINAVKSLRDSIQEASQKAIEQAKQDCRSQVQTLEQRLKDKESELTHALDREQEQRLKFSELESNYKELESKFDHLQALHTEIESDRNVLRARTQELKERTSELKEENRAVRDHFEHYQQRTADDRQLERDQFQSQLKGLQSQTDSLTSQLAQMQREKEDYRLRNEQAQEHTKGLTIDNQELKINQGNLREQLKGLSADCERKDNELHESEQNFILMRADYINQKELLARQGATLASIEAELKLALKKAERLDSENKAILEEKALLQGRLVQFQASIGSGK